MSQLDDRADALQVEKMEVFSKFLHHFSGRCLAIREVSGYAEAEVLVEEHQDDHHHVRHRHPPGDHHRNLGRRQINYQLSFG